MGSKVVIPCCMNDVGCIRLGQDGTQRKGALIYGNTPISFMFFVVMGQQGSFQNSIFNLHTCINNVLNFLYR